MRLLTVPKLSLQDGTCIAMQAVARPWVLIPPAAPCLLCWPQVCLKCADLGHLTGSTDVHKRWVGLLEEVRGG